MFQLHDMQEKNFKIYFACLWWNIYIYLITYFHFIKHKDKAVLGTHALALFMVHCLFSLTADCRDRLELKSGPGFCESFLMYKTQFAWTFFTNFTIQWKLHNIFKHIHMAQHSQMTSEDFEYIAKSCGLSPRCLSGDYSICPFCCSEYPAILLWNRVWSYIYRISFFMKKKLGNVTLEFLKEEHGIV